jgi:hypothetical protein
MKLLRGKNWFEIQLTEHKGFYVGPLWDQEKDAEGTPQYKLFSLMTRRFKFRLLKDNHKKTWNLSFAGLWSSDGTKDQYINYQIKTSKFVNKG